MNTPSLFQRSIVAQVLFLQSLDKQLTTLLNSESGNAQNSLISTLSSNQLND